MANPEFMKQAEQLIAVTQPSLTAATICREISVTGVFGPSKSGKHSVLAMTDTPVAVWDTTRPLHVSDAVDKHNHLTTDSELQQVIDDLAAGAYVHAMIHPLTNEFYGVRAAQYAKSDSGNILVDMAKHRIDEVRRNDIFKRVAELMIVPSNFNQWHGMIGGSFSSAANAERFFSESEATIADGVSDTDLYVVPNDHIFTTANIVDAYAQTGVINEGVNRRGRDSAQNILARLSVRRLSA